MVDRMEVTELPPIVMVPVSAEQLSRLAAGETLPGAVLGIAPTAELAATFGVLPGEQAEAAALQLADVGGLTGAYLKGSRQVVVASLVGRPVASEVANGLVVLDCLPAGDVTAFFTGPGDATVAEQANGLSLDDAWELPGVQNLLAAEPLSWHDLSELVQL